MSAHTNYIRHLNAFFAQVRQDERLHAHHISLYLSLFQVWNQYRFQNPFPILREEVIRLCRIGSLNTYTRCLKELHQLGYIIYQPAPQRGAPSLISIVPTYAAKQVNATPQLTLFEEPLAIANYLPPAAGGEPPGCQGACNSNRKNATAHKWMLNDQPQKTAQHGKRNTRYTGTTAQPGQLQTNQNKCYEDPL